MPKVHKTLRLEAELAAAVDAYAEAHGMRAGAAFESLLRAGLDAAENGTREPSEPREATQEAAEDSNRPETRVDELRAVCEVLRASNADLRLTVSTLTAQLAVKDEQIQTAHELVDQAHKLQAAQIQRALPAEGGTSRPSLWERLTGRGRG